MKMGSCLLAAALLCFTATAIHADASAQGDAGWNSVSDLRLTVRFRGPSDVLAVQVLKKTEAFLTDTSRFLGLAWATHYTIVIAPSRKEFVELQPTTRPAPEWAGALTYPGLGMVLIMTPGAMNTGGDRYWSLLQHETTHLILGDAEAKYGTILPRWFQEGVATYVSGEMNLSRLLQLGWAQATGATPEFRDLVRDFPSQSSLAGAAYARSYLFIRYITRRFGEDAVARLVEASLREGGINQGAAAAFGVPLSELMAGFDQYARVKATWIPVISSTATIWGLITLLVLVTWTRKKVQGMRTMLQWEREEEMERLAASLQEKRSHEEKPTLH